jgi:Regulator of ribonuclease activity B
MTRVCDNFPDDENGEVLRRMQGDGDDFTKSRDIDFSVVFPSESAAEEFADQFRRSGLKVAVQEWEGERELPWDVTVTRYMLPTHAGITEVEEKLEDVAAPLGGRNDGWGCLRQPVQH